MADKLLGFFEANKSVLENYSSRLKFSAGECIFRIGEPGDKAYLLLSGEVSVSRLIKTREKELAVLAAGEIIGEVALFSGGPRTATARVKVDVEAVVFTRADVARLKSENLPVAYDLLEQILKVTVDRLRSTLDRFEVVYFWLS